MLVLNEQQYKKKETKRVVKLTREDKALQLFQAGAVSKDRISDDPYHVRSQKNPTVEYDVIPSMNVCTCIDFERTGLACKHIIATQIYRTSQIAATLTAAKIQALGKIGLVTL
jgi:SWIM zinc finger